MGASPTISPTQEAKYTRPLPISVRGDTGNISAATLGNTDAIVTLPADAVQRGHIISRIFWSYSSDPVTGRLTINTINGAYLDLDITKGGPGFLPFDPPLQLDLNQGATIVLQGAGTSNNTGKVMVECWRML